MDDNGQLGGLLLSYTHVNKYCSLLRFYIIVYLLPCHGLLYHCISFSSPPPQFHTHTHSWVHSYASTFEENRIGKDMLLDLDKVSTNQLHTLVTLLCHEMYWSAMLICSCESTHHLCSIPHPILTPVICDNLSSHYNVHLPSLPLCVCVCVSRGYWLTWG